MSESVASLLLRIEGDAGDGERSLAEFAAELAALDKEEANPKVDVNEAGALAKLAEISAAVKAVSAEEVNVKVDVDRGSLSGVVGAVSTAAREFEQLATSAGGAGGGIGGLRTSIGGLSGALNPATAGAAALAIAVGVTLVGALGALAASAAGAVAAVGALGRAVLLAAGAALSLAKVFGVLKAEDAAKTQQAQQSAQGDQAAAAAADQRAAATQGLADAHVRLQQAAVQAYREMADAAAAATTAELTLERATLSREEAALGIKDAILALKEFRAQAGLTGGSISDLFAKFTNVDINFNAAALTQGLKGAGANLGQADELQLEHLILNVRDARLREREATDGVSTAERNLNRARATNQAFQTQGIAASTQYAAALRGVRDAQQQLATAMRDPAVATGVAKVTALTTQLNGAEKKLLDVIRQVRTILSDTFGPGVQALISGIADALERYAPAITPLRAIFTRLGTVMGGAFKQFAAELAKPTTIAAIIALTAASAQLAGPITSALLSLFTILLNIAVAALPFVVQGIQALAGYLADVAARSGGVGGIIASLVGDLRVWLSVFGAIARVMLAFFVAADPAGRSFAQSIATAANHLAAWANSANGRKEIREFLAVAVPLALAFGKFLFAVLGYFLRMGEIAAPILTPILNLLTRMITISTVLSGWLAKLTKAIGGVLTIFTSTFGDVLAFLAGLVPKMLKAGEDLISGLIKGIKNKAGDLLNTIKDVATSPIGAFKHVLGIKSPSTVFEGFGRNITKGLQIGLDAGAKGLGTAAVAALATPVLAAAPAIAHTSNQVRQGGAVTHVAQDIDVHIKGADGGTADPRDAAVQFGELIRSYGKF